MHPPTFNSHYEVINYYATAYAHAIQSNKYQTFTYPWGAIPALLVIPYLLIPHQNRPWLKQSRFLDFGLMTAFSAYTIRYARARAMAPAMGLGLISAWGVIWIMAVMVVNDAQRDFMRIERTGRVCGKGRIEEKEEEERPGHDLRDDNAHNGKSTTTHQNGLRKRLRSHEQGDGDITTNTTNNGLLGTALGFYDHINEDEDEHVGPRNRHGEFAWQSYPQTPFIERLDWVLDLFSNFRGVGWSFRTSSLPPPPSHIQAQLQRNSRRIPQQSTTVHSGQPTTYPNRRTLLVSNLKTFLFGYLMLDILKTIMVHDPYFWLGDPTLAPPSFSFLPQPLSSALTSYPTLLRMYRLLLSQLAIQAALRTIFSLSPLFFSGLLGRTPLYPSLIGARAEYWMYPETWGPFSSILDRGLAGWWAGWWHQTFRFAFEEPGKRISLMLGLKKRGVGAKVVQIFVAFGLSGVLHACGSYTSAGSLAGNATHPITGSFLFFVLQAVGVTTEAFFKHLWRTSTIGKDVKKRVPRWVRRAFTFLYVYIWFYLTGPLLCDDFARAGIWLLEPVPISILRGSLGLGVKGDHWWCWSGQIVRWHGDREGRWWRSGIAF